MISYIVLENFQSHKFTKLELSDNFTCIVGSSRSGKSALVRALKWVLFGKWKAGFLRIGEKSSYIKITLKNGKSIVWIKGSNKNELCVDGQKFVSFGSVFPNEFLKLFPWSNDKFEPLVIASQDDPPFLLFERASERSVFFDSLVKVNNLTEFAKDIHQEYNKLNSDLKNLKDKLTDINNEMINYEGIEEKLKIVNNWVENVQVFDTNLMLLERLIKLKKYLIEKEDRLAKLNQKVQKLQQNEFVLEQFFFFEHLIKIGNWLKEKTEKIVECNKKILEYQSKIDELVKEGVYCPTCNQLVKDIKSL
jgi:exonuclease SbcC